VWFTPQHPYASQLRVAVAGRFHTIQSTVLGKRGSDVDVLGLLQTLALRAVSVWYEMELKLKPTETAQHAESQVQNTSEENPGPIP
jgi:hypothetical protein